MTTEERFNRIEHLTAGLAEERRKEQEENRQLWRDTQRQIDSLTRKLADTNDTIAALATESRAAHARLEEADKILQARIESLVSGIGKFIASQPPR